MFGKCRKLTVHGLCLGGKLVVVACVAVPGPARLLPLHLCLLPGLCAFAGLSKLSPRLVSRLQVQQPSATPLLALSCLCRCL